VLRALRLGAARKHSNRGLIMERHVNYFNINKPATLKQKKYLASLYRSCKMDFDVEWIEGLTCQEASIIINDLKEKANQ